MEVKQKVLAYIIRTLEEKKEVLVFDHRGEPEAGIQVPGGTVDPGEELEEALLREVLEESGLEFTEVQSYCGQAEYLRKDFPEKHERHFYLIDLNILKKELPHSWSHQVFGEGEDQGLIFDYYWMEVGEASQKLVAEMGLMLDQI